MKGTGMKYVPFVLLLVAVLITAGCVAPPRNEITVTPTQTTSAPTIITTTTVPTTVEATVPTDPFVGMWKFTYPTPSFDIWTINQDGTYKHVPYRNGQPTGENYRGTWRKSGTNEYVTADSRFVGKTNENTIGLTGESKYSWIYHRDTDTMTRDFGDIGIITFYRIDNVPSPSSSGQTQSGQTHLIGRGDDVQSFTATGSGLRIFTMSHTGSHNFAVILKDGGGNYVTLLANEIGSYSGKKSERLTSGTYYLDITADGSWTIDISSV
jgi:hypothetical protein